MHARPGKRISVTMAIALMVVCSTGSGYGQLRLMQRGTHHEKLDFLLGRWNVETKRRMPSGETMKLEGIATFRWKYGVWLEGHETTVVEGVGEIHNETMVSYNPRKEVYEGAWRDNVTPGLVEFAARWLDEATWELDSGMFTFAGRPHRVVVTYSRISDRELRKVMRWTFSQSGDLEEVMVSSYRKAD